MSDYTELTHELRMTHCSNEGLHDQAADAIVQLQADLAAARARVDERDNIMGRIAIALFGDQNNRADEECVARAAEIGYELTGVKLRAERAEARVAELEAENSARSDLMQGYLDCWRNDKARAERAEADLAAARARISYLEPIFIAARELVDNAEEYECEGLGLFAQHGWWEPLHDALDPDGSAAADDIRQSVAPAK